jgi:hypothetical protein
VLGIAVAVMAGGCIMPNPAYLGESQTDGGGSVGGGSGSTSGTSQPMPSGGGQSQSGSDSTTPQTSTSSNDSDDEASGASTMSDETPASSSSTSGPSSGGDCPDDPALLVCLEFEVDDPADVVDDANPPYAVTVAGGGMVATPWGQGLHLDEETEVEVDCMGACDGGPMITYEAWVRVAVFPGPSTRAGVVDNDGILGMFVTNERSLRCVSSSGVIEGGTLQEGAWTHVACVAEGTSLTAYVDGAQVSQATISPLSPPSPAYPLAIGNNAPAFDNPLLGDLDRVRVWRRALSRDEVVATAEG